MSAFLVTVDILTERDNASEAIARELAARDRRRGLRD
jgi:hypothetical protein